MTAPSAEHERRVDVLRDLARLSHHVQPCRLGSGTLPDAVYIDLVRGRLMVGDAKATEHSGNAETRRRLRGYRTATLDWRVAGFEVRIVLCHEEDAAGGWEALLADLEPTCGQTGTAVIGGGDQLTWVDLGRLPRASSTRSDLAATVR